LISCSKIGKSVRSFDASSFAGVFTATGLSYSPAVDQKRPHRTSVQVTRFGLIGALNTLVDYVVFIGLTIVFRIPLSHVWIAKYPSSAIAMINSYLLNRRFVFPSGHRRLVVESARFFSTTIVGVFVIQNLLTQFFASDFQYFGKAAFRVLDATGLSSLQFSLLDRTLGFTETFTIKTVAFALATLASLTWNFLTYKYWAFRRP
jgi:putative flippase GtrA